MTERHLIIPLQPWQHERMTAPLVDGYVWRGDQPFRVMVIDKNDYANRRMYELPPMFFFHTGDAWEEADGTIRFDLCASPNAHFVTEEARSMISQDNERKPSAELVMAVLHADGRAELQRSGITANSRKPIAAAKGLHAISLRSWMIALITRLA
jgi:all-trans-8'-apo-beta-carotenal 15,15'-oxygenase